MKNPFERKPDVYEPLREQLLEELNGSAPADDEFGTVMEHLERLDKITKRSSETKKALIAASGTVAGVVGIYALQQFVGVIVPKALDALASRHTQKFLDGN